MKALTILQPWAWAIIHGPKRIENRSWRTHHRGPLLIHAGKSRARLCTQLNDGTPVPRDLVFRAFLGMVDVVDCIPVAEAGDDPFAEGPWCWILRNPRPLRETVPFRGAQLLWTVPDDVERCLLECIVER